MARRSSGTPATDALDRAGVAYTTHSYQHDPAAASYGLEAAEQLGVDPSRVFKTLVVNTGDGLVTAVVPVEIQLDLKALAAACGVKKAAMATSQDAERSTGMVVGGISPVGQRRTLPTVLDDSMCTQPTVFVSGGKRGFDIELGPADLARITAGKIASIGTKRKL